MDPEYDPYDPECNHRTQQTKGKHVTHVVPGYSLTGLIGSFYNWPLIRHAPPQCLDLSMVRIIFSLIHGNLA
jgi:hypothetical protein